MGVRNGLHDWGRETARVRERRSPVLDRVHVVVLAGGSQNAFGASGAAAPIHIAVDCGTA